MPAFNTPPQNTVTVSVPVPAPAKPTQVPQPQAQTYQPPAGAQQPVGDESKNDAVSIIIPNSGESFATQSKTKMARKYAALNHEELDELVQRVIDAHHEAKEASHHRPDPSPLAVLTDYLEEHGMPAHAEAIKTAMRQSKGTQYRTGESLNNLHFSVNYHPRSGHPRGEWIGHGSPTKVEAFSYHNPKVDVGVAIRKSSGDRYPYWIAVLPKAKATALARQIAAEGAFPFPGGDLPKMLADPEPGPEQKSRKYASPRRYARMTWAQMHPVLRRTKLGEALNRVQDKEYGTEVAELARRVLATPDGGNVGGEANGLKDWLEENPGHWLNHWFDWGYVPRGVALRDAEHRVRHQTFDDAVDLYRYRPDEGLEAWQVRHNAINNRQYGNVNPGSHPVINAWFDGGQHPLIDAAFHAVGDPHLLEITDAARAYAHARYNEANEGSRAGDNDSNYDPEHTTGDHMYDRWSRFGRPEEMGSPPADYMRQVARRRSEEGGPRRHAAMKAPAGGIVVREGAKGPPGEVYGGGGIYAKGGQFVPQPNNGTGRRRRLPLSWGRFRR